MHAAEILWVHVSESWRFCFCCSPLSNYVCCAQFQTAREHYGHSLEGTTDLAPEKEKKIAAKIARSLISMLTAELIYRYIPIGGAANGIPLNTATSTSVPACSILPQTVPDCGIVTKHDCESDPINGRVNDGLPAVRGLLARCDLRTGILRNTAFMSSIGVLDFSAGTEFEATVA